MKITKEFLLSGMSERGGWNKRQLEAIGAEWPTRRGWQDDLMGREITDEQVRRFMALRGQTVKEVERGARSAPEGLPARQLQELGDLFIRTGEALIRLAGKQ